MLKEGVQLAATDILEVCAVNTVGLHNLSTHELFCTVHNPGQKKHLPEDVGNKDMILLQLQRELYYQN